MSQIIHKDYHPFFSMQYIIFKKFQVLRELSFRWIFVLGAVLICMNGINQNYVDGTSEDPLSQFLEYRETHGRDTAREDMLDNGVIDNSINSARFEIVEPEIINYENEEKNILISKVLTLMSQ
jgi:hypothetical protein